MPNTDAHSQNFFAELSTLLKTSEDALRQLSDKVTALLQNNPTLDAQTQDNLSYIARQTQRLLAQNNILGTNLHQNNYGDTKLYIPASPVELLQWQEEAYAKTAKTLEDTDGQLLANAIFELAAVKSLIDDERSNKATILEGVNALQGELEQGLADLRFLVAELEPTSLFGNFGLVAGLRRYLEKLQTYSSFSTELQVHTLVDSLPNIIEVAIFRVIQEVLQNIRHHAKATKVHLIISETQGNLNFKIQDNGLGMSKRLSSHPRRQLGLVRMKEIANLLNGEIHINSEEKVGTTVMLTIPYPKF